MRSADGLPDPAGPLAFRASGRIDAAARLRRLLDHCKAGAAAGRALALDPVGFGLFHRRSQMTVSLIRPHYRSHRATSRISAKLSAPAGTFGSCAGSRRSRRRRIALPWQAISASFFGRAADVLEPFLPRPDLPLPGALQNSGTKPAPPSEHTPLGRRSAFLPCRPWRSTCRCSEVLIDVNMELRVVPRPLTTAMMARLMPAAIKPYSIAVAAELPPKAVCIWRPPQRDVHPS